MKRLAKLIILTALAYGLAACHETGCDSAARQAQLNSIHPVSGFQQSAPFRVEQVKRIEARRNIIGQPTIAMVLGANNQNLFEVTLLHSNVQEGYTVHSERFSHPEILLTTQWCGSRFEQSADYSTLVSLTIGAITAKRALIYLSGTLVNPTTGEFVTLSPSIITVQGAHLKELLSSLPDR